jgi:hypothetical protein
VGVYDDVQKLGMARIFVIKIRRKWPSHNNVRIGSKQVQSNVTCFYSKMLLHVSAFQIGHHQAFLLCNRC